MDRLKQVLVVGAVLTAAAAGCGDNGPPLDEMGQISMHVTAAPNDVTAIHVVVSATDIPVDIIGDLEQGLGGVWSGAVLNVPAGAFRTVTASGYSAGQTLIYKGSTDNVSVFAGQLTAVTVHLLKYPNDSGSDINTPPHFALVTHPDTMAPGETLDVMAMALDPDNDALLTYTWSSTPTGTFDDDDVDHDGVSNVVDNQVPGEPVVVHYTAPNVTGFALVQVTVSDGQSAMTTSFAIAVGSGIAPGIQFDVLPDLEITAIERQALMPSGSTEITYTLSNPGSEWTAAPMHLRTTWSDSCGGLFTSADSEFVDVARNDSVTRSVVYTATDAVPNGVDSCGLRLTVVDDVGGSMWSGIVVWIEEPLMVFVTSGMVDGADFHGHPAEADAFCQNYVTSNVGVSRGIYKALLSFDEISARDRIVDGPYVRIDGTPIARNKAELFFGAAPGAGLLNGIDLDQTGVAVVGNVFTGTESDGTTSAARCDNWTSNSSAVTGMAGVVGTTDTQWTAFTAFTCDLPAHVNCFQQTHVRE